MMMTAYASNRSSINTRPEATFTEYFVRPLSQGRLASIGPHSICLVLNNCFFGKYATTSNKENKTDPQNQQTDMGVHRKVTPQKHVSGCLCKVKDRFVKYAERQFS